MKFDKFHKFLIGYGGSKVFILNLATNEGHILKINENTFEGINDAGISSELLTVRCMVACKWKNRNQVTVFDILENNKEIDKLRENTPSIKQIRGGGK